jgi:Ca2+-binding EF-hand superfamily protein
LRWNGGEENPPMPISPTGTNPYDPAVIRQMRTAFESSGRQLGSADPAIPKQIRAFSVSGLSVFDAAQARLLGKMDVDGDGGLTAAELSAGVHGGQAPGAVDPAYFAAVDKDSDGKLQLGELQASAIFGMNTLDALLSVQEGASSTKPPARFEASNIGAWIVSEADLDGDGVLTAEEFAKVGPSGDYAAPRPGVEFPGSDIRSKSERAFFDADADQDGRLTGEELAEVMETGPHRFVFGDASKLAPTLMHIADTDGDAAISVEEARAGAKSPTDLDAMFKLGDANSDGKLNAAEMKAMIDAKPTFYSSGLYRLDDQVVDGHAALRGLLLASLDRVSESFRARFDPPRTQTTA